MERLKKTFTRTVCIYCGGPLTHEDRVMNGFGISKLSEKTGYPIKDHEVNSIYEAHKITGLSASSLINAHWKNIYKSYHENIMFFREKIINCFLKIIIIMIFFFLFFSW